MARVGERLPGFCEVLPTSVIEIAPHESVRRRYGQQDNVSSRADFSPFPLEASDLCFQLYLRDCQSVFDPFAGWGERHAAAQEHGIAYTGFDCNPLAIELAASRHEVNNQLANSETAEIPFHDGLITCPPYWNLEVYSPDGIEQADEWEDFIARYSGILERCYDAAQVGAFYCILVGDWRSSHRLYDLGYQTRKIMIETCGATLWDEVIISRRKISKIKIMLPQAIRLGYSVKVHETLLVFQKR